VTATNLGFRSSDLEPTQRRRTACDTTGGGGCERWGSGENFFTWDGEISKTTTVGTPSR